MLWVGLTLFLTTRALASRSRLLKYDRGDGPLWNFWTASIFAFGALFAWLAQGTARTAEKLSLSRVLFWCDTIAMMTYLITGFRLTPALSSLSGTPVDVARFLEWVGTCPVLIMLIGEVTKQPKIAKQTMIFDYIMLCCGFMASITRDPYAYLFSWIAFGCFSLVVRGLYDMFTDAIEGKTDCHLSPGALEQARFSTVVSWSLFPAVWLMVHLKFISFSTGELFYGLADIMAKVVLTLILVNATVEQAQTEKVDALSSIAEEMEKELGNTDKLLQRMMPPEVIEQLKSGKAPGAEEYANVTVFFSDIANFTVLSSQTSTKEMLETLNKLWIEYDAIAKRWGVYKVETIGDAYLGVTGCPQPHADHASQAVNFAIDIIAMVQSFKTAMGSAIQIRVGLNSGPITAGVLGDLNPHWCIVGDTVNTASRMESTSKPMQIHISESTFNLVKSTGQFNMSGPDLLQVKGKGTMATYWVHGRL